MKRIWYYRVMEPQGNSQTGEPAGKLLQGRFAVLRHECGSANGGAEASHWDLLLELPGEQKLVTWQVRIDPAVWPRQLPAERIADHRKIYLTYEGQVSGDRGSVKRVAEGGAAVQRREGGWALTLEGRGVTGEFWIADGR